jgi:hypothetical protein
VSEHFRDEQTEKQTEAISYILSANNVKNVIV